MASSAEFKDYVLDNLRGVVGDCYELSHIVWSERKMFGDYCIYASECPSEKKAVFLICDDTLFIKQHECLAQLLCNHDKAKPYKGAKDYYVLDIDSSDIMQKILILALPHIQIIQPKRTKTTK